MGVVIPSFASKSGVMPTYSVGVVEPATDGLMKTLEAQGTALGATLAISTYITVEAAREELRIGLVDAVVIPDQEVLVPTEIDPSILSDSNRLASALASAAGSYSVLSSYGLSDNATISALNQPPLKVSGLDPAPHRSAKNAAAAGGSIVILFVFLNLYGAFILNGVIEEKSSRVVEILLSTVRAEELLLGKVLGIGIVGTIQGAVLVLAAFIANANVQNTDGGGLSVSVVMYTVLWFLIGFGMYAWLYACAGALVSRSEDSQSLVFLLQVPLLISYLVAFIATVDGPSKVGTALSIFPLTAPMIMLERMAAQEVPFWQVIISIALCLATIWVIMRLAVHIFRGGVLRSGGRVKIREAWRIS